MTSPPDRAGPAEPQPDEQTVVVFRTWDDVEANLVAGLLHGAGIHCTIVSDVPHAVYPLTVDGLGEVRVVVARGDEEAARACIAARPEPAGEAPPDEGEGTGP